MHSTMNQPYKLPCPRVNQLGPVRVSARPGRSVWAVAALPASLRKLKVLQRHEHEYLWGARDQAGARAAPSPQHDKGGSAHDKVVFAEDAEDLVATILAMDTAQAAVVPLAPATLKVALLRLAGYACDESSPLSTRVPAPQLSAALTSLQLSLAALLHSAVPAAPHPSAPAPDPAAADGPDGSPAICPPTTTTGTTGSTSSTGSTGCTKQLGQGPSPWWDPPAQCRDGETFTLADVGEMLWALATLKACPWLSALDSGLVVQADHEVLRAVACWAAACLAEPSEGLASCATDGLLSLVWGYAVCVQPWPHLLSCGLVDGLCRELALRIAETRSGSELQPTDLADLAWALAATPHKSAAVAQAVDAIAHEVYRQVSNRHSLNTPFNPPELVKLVQAFAALDIHDYVVARMLDAVAGSVVKRIRARAVNAMTKPRDMADLLVALCRLQHRTVVIPELLSHLDQQLVRGLLSHHEWIHSNVHLLQPPAVPRSAPTTPSPPSHHPGTCSSTSSTSDIRQTSQKSSPNPSPSTGMMGSQTPSANSAQPQDECKPTTQAALLEAAHSAAAAAQPQGSASQLSQSEQLLSRSWALFITPGVAMELLGAHQVLGYRPPHALLTCLMVALLPQRQMASASQLAVLVKLLADFSHHPGSRTLHLWVGELERRLGESAKPAPTIREAQSVSGYQPQPATGASSELSSSSSQVSGATPSSTNMHQQQEQQQQQLPILPPGQASSPSHPLLSDYLPTAKHLGTALFACALLGFDPGPVLVERACQVCLYHEEEGGREDELQSPQDEHQQGQQQGVGGSSGGLQAVLGSNPGKALNSSYLRHPHLAISSGKSSTQQPSPAHLPTAGWAPAASPAQQIPGPDPTPLATSSQPAAAWHPRPVQPPSLPSLTAAPAVAPLPPSVLPSCLSLGPAPVAACRLLFALSVLGRVSLRSLGMGCMALRRAGSGATLTLPQLLAVAAAGQALGEEGQEMMEEVLPEQLLSRCAAALRGFLREWAHTQLDTQRCQELEGVVRQAFPDACAQPVLLQVGGDSISMSAWKWSQLGAGGGDVNFSACVSLPSSPVMALECVAGEEVSHDGTRRLGLAIFRQQLLRRLGYRLALGDCDGSADTQPADAPPITLVQLLPGDLSSAKAVVAAVMKQSAV